ncbi:S-layer homology domain-containing protein [Paenibacillus sp. MDMC362]|uniref:S-layer homology domain-containing protein n=1 Tax=Paenibacillus sp. MDMC362 TaxID=2977365 RepID=UPI000DC49339|nr:S-layer homology domain-containing protein [Paenibacillus sp. MDMC362]RAR39804.1 S-layer protein [Paenibacillus sp. MDMC362]
MSDKSYQIKENNQVMIQGGEKKVMKKILSVALSTAMAFSMFASVAFGDDALNTQQKFDVLKEKGIFTGYPDGTAGLDKEMTRAEFAKVLVGIMGLEPIQGKASFKDKNYKADKWPAPYVEAVYAAGLMEGKNTTKMIFDFNGKITVQEMAKVLVTAQKLEIPTETNNNASDWAKGYVQAAINAGLVDAKANPKANASRSQLVEVAYTIYLSQQKPKVVSYDVTESGKVVTFKLANNESVKVELETPLKANTATEVKFTHNNYEYTESVTWVVTSATKVESASASNLKEVDVVFDGKVDKATATDKNNYSIDSNSKGIKSITLLEDGKTARLLLNESSKFAQGTTYKVVVKNVKNNTGSVLPQGEVSFTVTDNTLPTVTEVKALGTKVIKVTFSEPVVAPTSSNFQLDDKAFVGSVTQGANQREVILRDYTGSIAVGAHKLTTSLIEDYAGLKSLADTKEFTVAVDSEGPKVTEISATLEKVTVTFDEEIDPDSVTTESFYWLSGTTKKTGKATQIAANVYEVDFNANGNRLPGYETTLHIDVKDYSGNVNAVKEHKVTASVDLVRPQVVETTFGDRTNTLTVRFDKAVNAADKKYFTVKKGNDVIPVSNVVAADASSKIFYVTFFNTLASGTYSLKVADVQDTTALKNTLVEYNGTFVANDTANPTISSTDYNEATRKLTLNFGREMDLATVNVKGNYYINFQKNGANAQNIAIPNEVTVNAVNGGKSVVLQFPEYIDGTKVTFGPSGSVKGVTTTGLKSKTGQVVSLDSSVLKDAATNQLKWTAAVQKDAKTFELTFNQVIATANIGDFLINGTYPSSVSIDENKVTLKTTDEVTGGTITLFANNSIETYSNNKLNLSSNASMPVNNAVAPRVTKVDSARTADNEFVIEFSSNIDALDANVRALIANDLVVKDLSETNTPALTAIVDYTATIQNNNEILVKINKESVKTKPVSVQVKDARYIVAAGTTAKAVDSSVYTVNAPSSSVTNPTVSSTKVTDAVVGVKAVAVGKQFTLTAAEAGVKTDTITVDVDPNAASVTSITYNSATGTYSVGTDVTVDALVERINNTQANEFTALRSKDVEGSTKVVDDTLTFAKGVDAAAGTLTVNLSKAVDSIVGKVTVGTKTYDNAQLSADKKAIVVVLGDGENVVGDQFKATVQFGSSNVDVSVTIAK